MANWNIYDNFRLRQNNGNGLDLDTPSGTFKIAVVTSLYTPNQNTHDFFDDITNEVSGTNYSAGGQALTTPTFTMDGAGLCTFDTADPATISQHASGFENGRRCILYHDTGVSTTSVLVAYSDDFGADAGNKAGDFDMAIDAAGHFTLPR